VRVSLRAELGRLRCVASDCSPKMKIRLQCAGEYRIGYLPAEGVFSQGATKTDRI
jgi:hypothetical protein